MGLLGSTATVLACLVVSVSAQDDGCCGGPCCAARENQDVTGVVEESSASVAAQGVADHTTYRLGVKLSGDAETMYTIFGREGSNMTFPPAFQVANPFGTNVSPPSPALGDQCSLWGPGLIHVLAYHMCTEPVSATDRRSQPTVLSHGQKVKVRLVAYRGIDHGRQFKCPRLRW